MTQEQREHIAATIGMLDAVSSMLMGKSQSVAILLGEQCELLQAMLDTDREE